MFNPRAGAHRPSIERQPSHHQQQRRLPPHTHQQPEGERGAATAIKGILGNVIEHAGKPALTSAPRPKAALRRKFVLRYPTLEYQHEQPSRIHIGWHQRLRRVPRLATDFNQHPQRGEMRFAS
jgi:hypothetical protein